MRAIIRSWPRFAAGLGVAVLMTVSGCGGGGGGGGGPQGVTAPPRTGGNNAPEIQGQPRVAAVVGQAYSFQPQATDVDNDPITFTISSKPSWATFDAATGRLSGTPTPADVGVHERIEIAATDGTHVSALPPFALIVSLTQAASVTIGWDLPTQNDDGTPLTDLAGFRLYYGSAAQDYAGTIAIDNANMNQHVVENLPTGTYYFAVTAINAEGTESVYSTEISTTI